MISRPERTGAVPGFFAIFFPKLLKILEFFDMINY